MCTTSRFPTQHILHCHVNRHNRIHELHVTQLWSTCASQTFSTVLYVVHRHDILYNIYISCRTPTRRTRTIDSQRFHTEMTYLHYHFHSLLSLSLQLLSLSLSAKLHTLLKLVNFSASISQPCCHVCVSTSDASQNSAEANVADQSVLLTAQRDHYGQHSAS